MCTAMGRDLSHFVQKSHADGGSAEVPYDIIVELLQKYCSTQRSIYCVGSADTV